MVKGLSPPPHLDLNIYTMLDFLRKIQKILNAISKLLPSIIDVLQDLADDGKRNHSADGTRGKVAE